jgi:hypothetical protein
MGIFKEHSYDIVKLYINQIGITIFSMFLYTAVGTIEDSSLFNTLRILVSVFSILFYFVLVYHIVWELGAKDKIRIDSGRYSPKPLKGGILALYANIPNLVLALLAVIFVSLYLIFGFEWCESAFAIVFLIVRFHAAMYMGVVQGVTPAAPGGGADMAVYTDALLESVWFIVLPLVAVLFTQFTYWLGSKERKFFRMFAKDDTSGDEEIGQHKN